MTMHLCQNDKMKFNNRMEHSRTADACLSEVQKSLRKFLGLLTYQGECSEVAARKTVAADLVLFRRRMDLRHALIILSF